jgi:hypothetical protein
VLFVVIEVRHTSKCPEKFGDSPTGGCEASQKVTETLDLWLHSIWSTAVLALGKSCKKFLSIWSYSGAFM